MISGDVTDGWLVIDKPVGVSSNFVNTKIKRHFEKRVKVGFAGTLDPLASGVLPVALGKATRTCSFMLECDKKYTFSVVWGKKTTTDDAEGEVIAESHIRPNEKEVLSVMGSFIGEIMQVPPPFSAIKISGKRACDRVRSGEQIELSARKVNVFDLKLLSINAVRGDFLVHCSKGTYVRSIARDLAEKLGSCGYAENIRRVSVGKFLLNQTITLEKFLSMVHTQQLDEHMLPMDYALDDIPACYLQQRESEGFKYGQFVETDGGFSEGELVRVYGDGGQFLGFGRILGLGIVPVKVFV